MIIERQRGARAGRKGAPPRAGAQVRRAAAGVLVGGAGLHSPEAATSVQVRDGDRR